jgi:His-Xaa-Ser system protein HxsD
MNKSSYFGENRIDIFLNVSLYSKDAIFKCLYWYTDRFNISISFLDKETYRISLSPLSNKQLTEDEAIPILEKLGKDFIDFNLRDIVTKETQTIRELLTAKAFSTGEFDELPPGEVSDPVGFNIDIIEND